jgi:hypothetical protein
MILLDLEKALSDFQNTIRASGVNLPGALVSYNPSLITREIDISNSIFNILILNNTSISFTHLYSPINPKEYFKYYMYDTDYYLPDSDGKNILMLSSEDIQYINDINSNNPPSVSPTSDFLLAHYDINHNPETMLGKIIKFVRMIYQYIESTQNPVTNLD